MRNLLFIMMALLVAPAMADVTISIVNNDDCTADIVLTTTTNDTVGGAEIHTLVAGLALNLSVAPGVIEEVTGFMTTGVSTAAAPGFGIYMDTMTFNVDPGPDGILDTADDIVTIADVGTPVAPASAPDTPGQLPGSNCVLQFGSLFDVAVPGDAAEATTILCTVKVSEEDAILTISLEDVTRGGIKNIGGGDPIGAVTVGAPVAVTGCGCYLGPDQQAWLDRGSPESWCTDRQCHGEADNLEEVYGRGTVWVGIDDITILLTGFRQSYPDTPPADPDTTYPWIVADFDHAREVYGRGTVPVGLDDISVLLAHFRQSSVPADCQTDTPVSP